MTDNDYTYNSRPELVPQIDIELTQVTEVNVTLDKTALEKLLQDLTHMNKYATIESEDKRVVFILDD